MGAAAGVAAGIYGAACRAPARQGVCGVPACGQGRGAPQRVPRGLGVLFWVAQPGVAIGPGCSRMH
eukprot:2906040-Lingulodinium_polyedra.AAC.1